MSEPVLLVDKTDGIATLTLNRPAQRNAMSLELRSLLQDAVKDLKEDEDIGVVILTGAGKAFSAGMDLNELADPDFEAQPASVKNPAVLLTSLHQPVIAAINGLAVTGGLEVAVACDIIIASTEAQFADTHAQVGFVPSWGLSQRLSRIAGTQRAKEMSLTGNFISAQQAYEWGLVNHVVSPKELMSAAISLAKDILSCVPQAMFMYKRMIDGGFNLPFAEALEYELGMSKEYKGPSAEGIGARRRNVQSRGKEKSTKR